jgi:hypothetical protein
MNNKTQDDIPMKGAPPCVSCHMLVARYAPQVSASTGTYHRECFEAWYFARYGKRPALQTASRADRHRFQIRGGETVSERAA